MAGETPLTLTGNIGGDPELRFTSTGTAKPTFSVGSTPRRLDKNTNEWVDGDTLWLHVVVWGQPAENCAETLAKGMRVVVTGRLTMRSYETKEGDKRTLIELVADDVAVSLKNATAKVTRTARRGPTHQAAAPDDPWATTTPAAAGSNSDDPPF